MKCEFYLLIFTYVFFLDELIEEDEIIVKILRNKKIQISCSNYIS